MSTIDDLRNFLDLSIRDDDEVAASLKDLIESFESSNGPYFCVEVEKRKRFARARFDDKSITNILREIRIAEEVPSGAAIYFPVDLETSSKFKYLSCFIQLNHGNRSVKPRLSMIVAVFALTSGSILKDEAIIFLNEKRGKWIDLSLPNNSSVEFARFMLKVADEALTDEEQEHFEELNVVESLPPPKYRNMEAELTYSSFGASREDTKDQCVKCKQWRSITTLLDDSCVACEVYPNEEALGPENETTSYMFGCKKCGVFFAVHKVPRRDRHDMEIRTTTCYYCHQNKAAPYVECQHCKNKFVYRRSKPLQDFECALCKAHRRRTTEMQITTFRSYFYLNETEVIGTSSKNNDFAVIAEGDLSGLNNKQNCAICFSEFQREYLYGVCGRGENKCQAKACRPCILHLHTQLKLGRVCQPAHFFCPFCKLVPIPEHVRQYNKLFSKLLRKFNPYEYDRSFIHAWCKGCRNIKAFIPITCGEENQIEAVDFICGNCRDKYERDRQSQGQRPRRRNEFREFTLKENLAPRQYQECPACGVMTEKFGGCNHITCLNVNESGEPCNTHWCWKCGEKSTKEDIYRHLGQEHGGINN